MSDFSIRNNSYNFLPTSSLSATRQNVTANRGDAFTESAELNNSSGDRFVPSSYDSSSSSVPKRSDMMRYSKQGVRSQNGATKSTKSRAQNTKAKTASKAEAASQKKQKEINYAISVVRRDLSQVCWKNPTFKGSILPNGAVKITATEGRNRGEWTVVNGKLSSENQVIYDVHSRR